MTGERRMIPMKIAILHAKTYPQKNVGGVDCSCGWQLRRDAGLSIDLEFALHFAGAVYDVAQTECEDQRHELMNLMNDAPEDPWDDDSETEDSHTSYRWNEEPTNPIKPDDTPELVPDEVERSMGYVIDKSANIFYAVWIDGELWRCRYGTATVATMYPDPACLLKVSKTSLIDTFETADDVPIRLVRRSNRTTVDQCEFDLQHTGVNK